MLTQAQQKSVHQVQKRFEKDFKSQATDCFQSCGRLEIIGNHLDYNGGFVVNSNAGNLNIFTAAAKAEGKITIKSEGYPDLVVDLNDLEYKKEEEETSVALVKGICARYLQLGYKIGGLNVEMVSTIVKGGGVSSSASYCVMVCKMLSYFYNGDKLDSIEMCKISRWSENNYFGKGSGLQDEIGCCTKGFAITDYKDQNNPKVTYFNVDLGDYKIMLLDTKTDHSESQGGFQELVTDMQAVCKELGIKYLIDIPYDDFMVEYLKPEHKNKREWMRAYHFHTEVKRTLRAYEDLKKNDIKAFLKEFNESGESSEYMLKSIVAAGQETNNLKEALHLGRESIKDGAVRVHGGGFGGTMMIIINKNEEKEFKKKMSTKFAADQFIDVIPSSDPLRRIPDAEIQ